jgi:hypothetical protein
MGAEPAHAKGRLGLKLDLRTFLVLVSISPLSVPMFAEYKVIVEENNAERAVVHYMDYNDTNYMKRNFICTLDFGKRNQIIKFSKKSILNSKFPANIQKKSFEIMKNDIYQNWGPGKISHSFYASDGKANQDFFYVDLTEDFTLTFKSQEGTDIESPQLAPQKRKLLRYGKNCELLKSLDINAGDSVDYSMQGKYVAVYSRKEEAVKLYKGLSFLRNIKGVSSGLFSSNEKYFMAAHYYGNGKNRTDSIFDLERPSGKAIKTFEKKASEGFDYIDEIDSKN